MIAGPVAFNAAWLARGWLAVAQASGVDKERPVLHKTISVELFADGVRLVATDSYLLLHTWVPALGKEDQPPRAVHDVRCERAEVAMDPHGRARGLLAYALALASADGAPTYETHLSIEDADEDEDEVLDGFGRRCVVLDHEGSECLRLGVFDRAYPHWRGLLEGFAAKRTAAIGLSTDRLGALAQLGKLFPLLPIEWRFGGHERLALIDIPQSRPHIAGAVMPVRVRYEDLVDGGADDA